jgi:hypothetical protein
VQLADPTAANVPAAHGEQAVAFAGEKVPAAHGVQLVEPAPAANVPAWQAVQLVVPGAVENLPAAQAVQIVFADVAHAVVREDPAAQTVHAWHAPPPRYESVGHAPH